MQNDWRKMIIYQEIKEEDTLSLSGVGFNFPAKSASSFELPIFYLCLSSLNFKLIQNLAPIFFVCDV